MMESEDFNKPIQIPVNKSIAEVIIMMMKYSLIHSLSLTEITDFLPWSIVFFVVINCLLPNTRYLIDKLFDPKNCTKFHVICTECGAYVGQFEREDCSVKCKVCKTEISVKNNAYKDFFVTMSLISKLIESNSEYYNYIMNNPDRHIPAWWRNGGSTCHGVPARRAGKMPSYTSASNGTVSAYHAGDTLWKRSYSTVPACRAISKLRVVV